MNISIITPVFNGGRFISNCIENVLGQNLEDFEHVIIDGGSTDNTLDVVQRYSKAVPHIRLINGPDRGQSDAMNKGIRSSSARFIGILNVDDTYHSNAVSNALRILETRQRVSFVVGKCDVLDENDAITYTNRPKHLSFEDFLLGFRQFPVNPSAYFYHRAIHDIVGFYDEDDHYSMDFEFLVRCAREVPFVFVDEVWGSFKRQPGGKTFEDQSNSQDRVKRIISKYEAELSGYHKLRLRLKRIVLKPWDDIKYRLWRLSHEHS